MYVSHNLFKPELVIDELQRRLDSPLIDFWDIHRYLSHWVKEWYEGSIDESDILTEILLNDLPLENIQGITILPIHWKTVKMPGLEEIPLMVGFPLILVEYF